MKNISDEVLSVEEAKAALRCMRLCSFDEEEALESIDSFVHRIRKVGMAKLIEEIVENHLSSTQKLFFKEYWYNNKNTVQIARENGVSQANVYRAVSRANETVRAMLTPLMMYQHDLSQVNMLPLYAEEIIKISSAMRRENRGLNDLLKSIRVSNAVTSEDMARAVCITMKELEAIESGRKEPSVTILARYSEIFGIEIEMKINNGKGRYEWRRALKN